MGGLLALQGNAMFELISGQGRAFRFELTPTTESERGLGVGFEATRRCLRRLVSITFDTIP